MPGRDDLHRRLHDALFLRKADGRGLGMYILDAAGEPVEVTDPMEWSQWFGTEIEARTVAKTNVGDIVDVSTVFLGIDHRFSGTGPPVLWETMVFVMIPPPPAVLRVSGDVLRWHDYQQRYTSRVAAVRGHNEVVQEIRASLTG